VIVRRVPGKAPTPRMPITVTETFTVIPATDGVGPTRVNRCEGRLLGIRVTELPSAMRSTRPQVHRDPERVEERRRTQRLRS
jgi:hypothetical protein